MAVPHLDRPFFVFGMKIFSCVSPNESGPFVHAAKKCAHKTIDKRAHTVLDCAACKGNHA